MILLYTLAVILALCAAPIVTVVIRWLCMLLARRLSHAGQRERDETARVLRDGFETEMRLKGLK